MTQKREVYKCPNCKNIVAVLQGGEGTLTCCGQEMVNVTPDEAKRLIHDLQRPGTP
jgi:desulfoferrodoxin-like iron-binding protein